MSVSRRSHVAAAVSLMVAASLFVMSPAEAYTPGTATAHKVRYNAATGKMEYYCSFARWRGGAKVTYKCKLYVVSQSFGQPMARHLVDAHKRSWTPPPARRRSPTYGRPIVTGQPALCVEATALSVDGGDRDYACNF